MNVLLVEDSDEKAAQVEAVLKRAHPVGGTHVERVKSFIGAVRALESKTYDLLVLDLVLPVRDNEAPSERGGQQVLSEIVDGTAGRRPSHIICLTAFEETADVLKEAVKERLFHLVIYKEDEKEWRDALEATARYVQSRLLEAETFPQDYKIDVAIVTSSPLVELNEVKKLPGSFVCEYNQADAIDYYSGNWVTKGGRQLSVVACAAPRMGMTAACATACKVIDRWRPRFLTMSGIAAATKREAFFGDILVAETAFDYGSGKIVDTDGGRHFTPSPYPINIDADLHSLLQRWEQDQPRMDEIRRAWHEKQARVPTLILGILASGAAVVQSETLVKEILSNSRKVVGLEMEAYALFHAAQLARAPRPHVLVAKSVSDFADKRKSDKWQQYAAFTSARFLYEFFTNATELQLGVPQGQK